MEIIVRDLREAIAGYREVADWVRTFDIDPDDRDFDELSLMEGDPDRIKWCGYEMSFFDVDLNGRKFILTSEEVDAESKLMLERFHSPNFERWYERLTCEWAAFDSTDGAIAYRGGGGYFYAIWKYLGETEAS